MLGYYGYTGGLEPNRRNWVTLDQVIECYWIYEKRISKGKEIPIEVWAEALPDHDSIIMIPLLFHLYVGLYYHKDRIAYIADGGNRFKNRIDMTINLKDMLKVSLIGCHFDQQNYIDHCGSSGVMIALEFKKAYFSATIPLRLISARYYQQRIRKSLYKDLSVSSGNDINSYKLACIYCQRKFKPGRNRSFTRHVLTCPQRQ